MSDPTSTRVRRAVYQRLVATGKASETDAIAADTGLSLEEAVAALRALAAAHILVLDADARTIRFAAPFSAVETRFQVTSAGRRYFAPCAWDAFGIPAALARRRAHRNHLRRFRGALVMRRDRRPRVRRGDDPPARPGGALLGRHRPHLTKYPSLPVGRVNRPLVPRSPAREGCNDVARPGVAAGEAVVRRPPSARFPTSDRRRGTRNIPAGGTERSFLGSETRLTNHQDHQIV